MTSGTSFSPPPAFGRFRLLHQIGAGVLGPVFRTHDPDGDRLVAVKAFTLDMTPERAGELVDHLQRVVDIDLEHPNIARPLATGVEESVAYLAQEYVAGESLDAAIRQYGPAPAVDAVRLITHVAEALDVAARVGVFHGALHPRDILVTPGETHVTGLGVSMALEKIGQHGPIRRPYAAPEREAGLEWGAAADVFSLAVIVYEVLTGRRALPGTEQPMPGLADLRVKNATALHELLDSAIDPEPDRRPAHARQFADALGAALVDAEGGAEKGDRPSLSRRKPRALVPKLPGLDDPLVPDVKSEFSSVAPPAPAGEFEVRLKPEPEPLRKSAPAPEAPPERAPERAPDRAPDRAPAPVVVRAFEPAPALEAVLAPETEPAPEAELAHEPAPAPAHVPESFDVPIDLRLRLTPQPAEFGPALQFDELGPIIAQIPAAVATDMWSTEDGEAITASAFPGPLVLAAERDEAPRPPPRYQPDAPRPARPWGMLAIGAAMGILIGVLGGFEIGSRWGATNQANTVAVPATSVRAPEMSMSAPATPVTEPVPAARVMESVPVPAPAAPIVAAEIAPKTIEPPEAFPRTPPASDAETKKPLPAAASHPGALVVASRPSGARVLIDGKDVGKSPLTMRKVAAGHHEVEFRLTGFHRWTTSVTVDAGKTQRVTASLEKDK